MHTGDMMSGGGSGDDAPPPSVERRLARLANRMTDLNYTVQSSAEQIGKTRSELTDFRLDTTRLLGGLDAFLAEIKGLLESKAPLSEVTNLQGSIRSLPTVWQLITLVFGILAGVFAIVRFGGLHP